MAIFEAEHRHRTASEDQLTSRIFGALSIMDKCSVLVPFLCRLTSSQSNQLKQLNESVNRLTDGQKKGLEVRLWEHFGKRTYGEGYPDVYIELPKYRIVIEVKEVAQATCGQIVRQYRATRNDEKEIIYFLLTNDDEEPRAVEDAKKKLKSAKIFWTQWKQVWEWLRAITNGDQKLSSTDKSLLEDLVKLLEDKGMSDFTTIKGEWFTNEVAESIDKLNKLFTELQYLGLSLRNNKPGIKDLELEEYINDKGRVIPLDFFPRPEWSLKPGNNQMVPDYIWLQYKDKRWKRHTSLKKAYIYICAVPQERKLPIGFYNEIFDDEWQRLKQEAEQARFTPEKMGSEKGRCWIEVNRHLIEDGTASLQSQEIRRDTLLKELENIRDFVRSHYKL